MQLRTNRKIGGDYEGARQAWEYVTKAGQEEIRGIAHGNLGDLYMNFLKDYPKAEANYLEAIKINPAFIDYYRTLATLYTHLYKTGTSAAADIIKQGLKANPGNPDLLKLQAAL